MAFSFGQPESTKGFNSVFSFGPSEPTPICFGAYSKSNSAFKIAESKGFSSGFGTADLKKHSVTFGSSSSPASDDMPRPAKDASTTTNPVIQLEIMVEKKTKRVVFAESNKDFIDLLFSFFTLPIGSILRILGEMLPPTSIACMNNINKSVRDLDARVFRTEACKEMLLWPRRSSESQCKNVKVKIADNSQIHKSFYFCTNSVCRREGKVRLSDFPNVRCHCGQVMSQLAREQISSTTNDEMDEVFVKGVTDMFLISDDLQVMPGSSSPSLMLLKKLRIADANELETESLTVGSEEILQLLRLTLISKTPLTHWIWLKKGVSDLTELELENTTTELQDKKSKTNESKKIMLKLFTSKSKNKVLFAECGEDFVDFLFSFLTLPLGSIVQLLDGSSSLVSIDNLYQSVKNLGTENYLKSEELKNMLIYPKLAPFHACENQLLDIEETSYPLYSVRYLDSIAEWFVRSVTTESEDKYMGAELGQFPFVNPKSSDGKTTGGGGFMRGPAKFMVTDSLVVTQLSAISSISLLAKLNVPITDVDATCVGVGKEEAMSLLKAALISERPLTDVFNQQTYNNVPQGGIFTNL